LKIVQGKKKERKEAQEVLDLATMVEMKAALAHADTLPSVNLFAEYEDDQDLIF
jgi:hypothetical protein